MKDGALVKDEDGWLRDENGMYINYNGSRTKNRTSETIGADGLETGLLNIMFGGTHGKPYEKFSDSQVAMVQGLLNYSSRDKLTLRG